MTQRQSYSAFGFPLSAFLLAGLCAAPAARARVERDLPRRGVEVARRPVPLLAFTAVHGQLHHVAVRAVEGLVPVQQLWLKIPVSVSRYGHFHLPATAAHLSLVLPVPIVPRISSLGFVFLLAQLCCQLRFQHLLQRCGKQPREDPLFSEKVVDALGAA